ncbi:MAG: endonuclease [Verrucomicrobia bacterium]|nr:endonuclease [Verrucomicrobiota bacterium]
MKDHEVREQLRLSLQDGRLERSERDALRQWLEETAPDGPKRAVYQSMAFDLAREALEHNTVPHYSTLNWLERIVKVLTPLASAGTIQTVAEACFSPQHDCAGRIAQLLDNARRSVKVCVFTITDNRIAEAMLRSHRRGVRLRVITDDDKQHDPGSDIQRLSQAGIAVRADCTEYHMHHKFAVFDGTLLLTGSYNWTRAAALHNEENFLLTSDPRLLQPFRELFEKLWSEFSARH